MALTIRSETRFDLASIRNVNEKAFGGCEEADIVDTLRRRGAVLLSLVAVLDSAVVGHILFSPLEIVTPQSRVSAAALGPMGVLPPHQRRGIGSRLVERGLETLRREGLSAVVVLGHPHYYPRFGFVPASTFGIRCQFDVPDEAFMAMELRRGALAGVEGVAHYRPEFGSA